MNYIIICNVSDQTEKYDSYEEANEWVGKKKRKIKDEREREGSSVSYCCLKLCHLAWLHQGVGTLVEKIKRQTQAEFNSTCIELQQIKIHNSAYKNCLCHTDNNDNNIAIILINNNNSNNNNNNNNDNDCISRAPFYVKLAQLR